MYQITDKTTDLVKIEMTSGDSIVVELDANSAPITVENFKNLVSQGFYDGLIFHRVISGFMIQGGDPQGTGMGGSKQTIKGEFRVNGVNNPISHERGVISMARSQFYNSASSQFFICHADAKFLDGQYAAFGKVVEGIETVDKIASVPTDRNDRPLSEQKMKAVCFVEEV
ncbi:MAG: peptidylprolyl isomerase [Bacteroides sp.]|nr:peptidylprolyl isomerase [Bacteroides sp.]